VRKEIFLWKILAKGQAAGGIGGEKEQLGISQTQAQANHQEDQAARRPSLRNWKKASTSLTTTGCITS